MEKFRDKLKKIHILYTIIFFCILQHSRSLRGTLRTYSQEKKSKEQNRSLRDFDSFAYQ